MFEQYAYLLDWQFAGNSGAAYFQAALVFFGAAIFLWLFKNIALIWLKRISQKTQTELDDIILGMADQVRWGFYVFVAFYFAAKLLILPPWLGTLLDSGLLLVIAYYSVKAAQKIVDYYENKVVGDRLEKDKSDDATAVHMLASAIKWSLWLVAGVLILANFGYDVSTLVAGLGIGGLAIALAAQNILADVFAFFSIYFDKPFKKGDQIIIGEDRGTVQKIGIKTTRLLTFQGEELIVSNKEITSIRVRKPVQAKNRRVTMSIGVIYNTPVEKLEKIPGIITAIINSSKSAKTERVHFKTFGDSALLFEISFLVDTPDYQPYLDIQQKINLDIMRAFEKEKIKIAYPTQTVYLKKEK